MGQRYDLAHAAQCGHRTLTFLAIWSGWTRVLPFSTRSPKRNALSILLFLIVMSGRSCFFAGVIEERSKGATTLRNRRRAHIVSPPNRRIWRFWFLKENIKKKSISNRTGVVMSDKGRAMFQLRPDEGLSRSCFLSRVHPEDRNAVDEAIERTQLRADF